jgi:hypothetical protein
VRADPRHFRAAVTVLLGVVQAGFAHGESRADGLDGAPRLVYAPSVRGAHEPRERRCEAQWL